MNLYLLYRPDTGYVVAHQITEGWPTVPDDLLCWACRDAFQWERITRVINGVVEMSVVPVRRYPRPVIPERADLLCQLGHGGRVRAENYDSLAEQVGRITKALSYLHDQGIDIGPYGREQVGHCQDIKLRYPVV